MRTPQIFRILALSLSLAPSAWAQNPIHPEVAKASPLEMMKHIGDRVISKTPFDFRLIPAPQKKEFEFIQFVNFGRTFGTGKAAAAIALSDLIAEKDTSLNLEISHTDGAKVYLNGQVVYTAVGNRPLKLIQRERDFQMEARFPVTLKKGPNRLVIKSETAGGPLWIVYLQPQGALTEFSEVKGLQLNLSAIPQVTPQVAQLSNWLVCGPFANTDRQALNRDLGPESRFRVSEMFAGAEGPVTWSLPRVEIFGDLINAHPLWGTYYNYNYHAAGVAWAMTQLSQRSQDPKYYQFAKRYCDFILAQRPFIEYQVKGLNGFRSAQFQQINTPLLDFTTAPCLPFLYHIHNYGNFEGRAEYEAFVRRIQNYVMTEQVRLPDGTFTRETPEKYTTWVDDMFMGIPFIIYSGVEAKDPAEKKKYFDEAAKQVLGFHKNVYDKKANLYYHAQYSTRPAPSIAHWSRANGWGIFAATEVLLHLPKNHPQRKAVLKIYQDHVAAIAKLQTPSGLWHQIIDDPSSYLETSATGIFTMAIARGINNGWLDRKTYEPIARKGWQGLQSQMEPDGTVHNICVGTMSSEDPSYYKNRPAVDDDSHGLLGLFICGLEMETLLKGK